LSLALLGASRMFKRFLLLIPCGKCFLVFFIIIFLGGALFAWSGLYSVAASRGHWWGVELLLKFGMRSSVRTHAIGIEEPDLNRMNLVQKGAAHFQIGCASCHGSPDRPASPVARAMLPEPPDLGVSVPAWKPSELFWIVKNGLKYTGMPAWPAKDRDDEVWAVVAFLLRLPGMKAAEFTDLSNSGPAVYLVPATELLNQEPLANVISTCSRCHGTNGAGTPDGAFPRLDIQTRDYLAQQLASYVSGQRSSGIMQAAVAGLDAESLRQLAGHFADKQAAPGETKEPNPSTDTGHMIANSGMPEQGLPACYSCHSSDPAKRNPLYPAIAGQYAKYTAEQLVLFKLGTRGRTAATDIMTVIAQRMTPRQIEAVSNYLERAGAMKAAP
jgi:cytochrome c553